jgi:formylglycine-generating enzyme required for sulfatase activity
MVVLPAGAFTMGSPKEEKFHHSDEEPQHVVTIAKPFAVGKLHVTVDQFAAFVRETGYEANSKCISIEGSSWRNPPPYGPKLPVMPQEGSHPVVCVSWDDAKAYGDWLARKAGKTYRLLSEAEWKYAARSRTSPGVYPQFWFGNNENDLCRYGNVLYETWKTRFPQIVRFVGITTPCNGGYTFTSPAGNYEPNTFGLYDMFGNAYQWLRTVSTMTTKVRRLIAPPGRRNVETAAFAWSAAVLGSTPFRKRMPAPPTAVSRCRAAQATIWDSAWPGY